MEPAAVRLVERTIGDGRPYVVRAVEGVGRRS